MNYSALALLFGLLQTITVVLLVADKWVHRVTGGKSLEARIADLEKSLDGLHDKASEYSKSQQSSIGRIETRLAAIDEHLRNTDANVNRLERRRGDR